MSANKTKLRNKADRLLQKYIKLKYSVCEVCEERPVFCGHHFVTKAHANSLRYEIENIIPICKECHCLVHNRPWAVEPKICFRRGEAWHNVLMNKKNTFVKANIGWYQNNVEKLQQLIKEHNDESRRNNQSA